MGDKESSVLLLLFFFAAERKERLHPGTRSRTHKAPFFRSSCHHLDTARPWSTAVSINNIHVSKILTGHPLILIEVQQQYHGSCHLAVHIYTAHSYACWNLDIVHFPSIEKKVSVAADCHAWASRDHSEHLARDLSTPSPLTEHRVPAIRQHPCQAWYT